MNSPEPWRPMARRHAATRHSGVMDMLFTMLGGKGMSGLLKTGTRGSHPAPGPSRAPQALVVTVDEAGRDPDPKRQAHHPQPSAAPSDRSRRGCRGGRRPRPRLTWRFPPVLLYRLIDVRCRATDLPVARWAVRADTSIACTRRSNGARYRRTRSPGFRARRRERQGTRLEHRRGCPARRHPGHSTARSCRTTTRSTRA